MSGKITMQIVSGFLGAGKTTFIQAMLQELVRRNQQRDRPEKVVYVVNEFGQSGIDKAIMADQPLLSYELTNGCICCSLKAEFSILLQQIIADHQPDRIIFEPSGLFILSELFAALSGEPYSNRLQIGSIVTLVDARHNTAQARSFNPLMQNQARLSDLLVVSKLHGQPAIQSHGQPASKPHGQSDLVLDRLVDLQLAYPDLPMLTRDAWDFTAADWQQVLDLAPRPLHQARLNANRQMIRQQLLWTRHHPKLSSVTVAWTAPATRHDIQARLVSLTDGQAGEIIRAKGFVRCDDRNWLIQMVRDQIDWHPASPGEEPRLTIIGRRLQMERICQLVQQLG
jgi:G3E family GTPase